MSDLRFDVKRYLDAGWSVIPIVAGAKRPFEGWKSKQYTPTDFDPAGNVGVRLGVNDLYDVDLDAIASSQIADVLLPRTDCIHGRPGKPRSHRFYTCPDANLVIEQYHDIGGKDEMLVELRGLDKNQEPTQTVIPPSVHATGEILEWDGGRFVLPPVVDPNGLRRGVRNVALATLLVHHWPAKGKRHHCRLALCGYLFRSGCDPAEITEIVRAITILTGGNEADAVETARDTIGKLQAGHDHITGGPALADYLDEGKKVLALLNKWLGRRRPDQAELPESELEAINTHFFLVEIGERVAVGDTRYEELQFWTTEEWKKLWLNKRLPSKRGDGESLGEAWLKHPKARTYRRLVYAPPPSLVSPDDYNGWRGFTVQPAHGSWDLNKEHLYRTICDSDDQIFEWLLDWCAALFQHPGRHGETAVCLLGGQGTGKGHFIDKMLGRCFDRRHYMAITDRRSIFGDFNNLMSGKVLLFFDEATWGGDKRDAGIIKGLVTNDMISINRKNLHAVGERSMLHLMIASNEEWPVGLDHDDRRFLVLAVNPARANDLPYFRQLHEELSNGGREAMLYELMTRPYEWERLAYPPMTNAKRGLKQRSMAPDLQWWHDILMEGRIEVGQKWPKEIAKDVLASVYLEAMQKHGKTQRRFESELGCLIRQVIPGIQVVRKNQRRFWILPSLDSCRAAFESYMHTPFDWETDLFP